MCDIGPRQLGNIYALILIQQFGEVLDLRLHTAVGAGTADHISLMPQMRPGLGRGLGRDLGASVASN